MGILLGMDSRGSLSMEIHIVASHTSNVAVEVSGSQVFYGKEIVKNSVGWRP